MPVSARRKKETVKGDTGVTPGVTPSSAPLASSKRAPNAQARAAPVGATVGGSSLDTPGPSALQISYRAPADLLPYERNARTHSEAQVLQIAASIREFGWTNPVLVDERDGVIAGHGRLLAAQLLGLEAVPCITVIGLSEAQRRALILADNKLALNAGWNDALLGEELKELGLADFDLSVIGFSEDELKVLFSPGNAGFADPDDAPPLEELAVSCAGDVWLLGKHRLACGSSTDPLTVEAALGGAVPHLMVTDPPYGVTYRPEWRNEALAGVPRADGKVGGGGRAVGEVLNDGQADWREAWALFPGKVAYVWHGGLHSGAVLASLEACRFKPRAQIIWVKPRLVISRGHYHWQHEPCWYAVADGSHDEWRFVVEHEVAEYAVLDGATADWQGSRKQTTVWQIEHVKSETGHGTQKPVEAMKRPMENNSKRGDAVYEPFSGSGTTIIAAELSGRVCHAVELSPNYVDVAVRRWQTFSGKIAYLESDGRSFEEVARGKRR